MTKMATIAVLLVFFMGTLAGCGEEDTLVSPQETVVTPIFDPPPGTYDSEQTVTILCDKSDVIIRYTTNGNNPLKTSAEYSGPIKISSRTMLKAKAWKSGSTASKVRAGEYIIGKRVATPTISPPGGIFPSQQTVTITCDTDNATIRYTTDGHDPTVSSTQYDGAIPIFETTTLKAKAWKSGYVASDVQNCEFVIENDIYVTHTQITQSPVYESWPRLGADATSEMVVYTAQVLQFDGSYGPGAVQVQRLNPDGTVVGAVIQVSDGLTSDRYPDVSSSLISYTALESTDSGVGKITVYDLETGEEAWATPEPEVVLFSEIAGNSVVWEQGQVGGTKIMYYSLEWQGSLAVTIGGSNPPSGRPAISDRYVVWERVVNDQTDIVAYDMFSGLQVSVGTSPILDEVLPATSGNRVVWRSTDMEGRATIEIADLSQTPIAYNTLVDDGSNLGSPSIDGDFVAYGSDAGGDYDIYLVRISDGAIFPITDRAGDQYLANVFGNKISYVDEQDGVTDIWVATFSFPGGM